MFGGGIIHFEIVYYCTSSILQKNLFPEVIPVEVSTTKISRGSAKCTL
jgi:hypothetical protein